MAFNHCLFRHTWAAMVLKVLLRMSPLWPLPKLNWCNILSQLHWLGMPWWDSHAASVACLGFACLDLRADPKSQISSTCKSTQIHSTSKNTNSTRTTYTAIHTFTLKLDSDRRVGLASWLRITLYIVQGTFLKNKVPLGNSALFQQGS